MVTSLSSGSLTSVSASGAWWLVAVLVAKLFLVFELDRALVLPMALLFAIHAAAFGAMAVALFLSQFLELFGGKLARVNCAVSSDSGARERAFEQQRWG